MLPTAEVPTSNRTLTDELAALNRWSDDPQAYARDWKERHGGRPVLGVLPMNFPAEMISAAGALPVVIQESREAITAGRNLLFEFYCGYTRSLADQAAKQQFEEFDGFVFADQCIQMQGAVDAMQTKMPEKPVRIAQFIASMDESWSRTQVEQTVGRLVEQTRELTGKGVEADALRRAIRAKNRNRRLLREIYELRRDGRTSLTARQMQVLVKSSMVMEPDEHTDALERILPVLRQQTSERERKVPLHLSGHFCHAPRPELLDVIEDCGAIVVDDDLFTGFRYISTDVPEDEEPFVALTSWYLNRNVTVPCPTRVQMTVDWDRYLLDAVSRSGAQAVIILMAKFCEPHMLYFPELRKALEANDVPFLLIETEHEGLPEESIRTRVETMLERIRRTRPAAPVSA